MVDPVTFRRWVYRGLFAWLAITTIYVNLLPVDPAPGRVPGPDLPVLIAFAWVLRRPDYVPVLLVALVMLMGDVLFLRPPGLWAALTLLGLEFLRRREPFWRDMPFLFEWFLVSVVIALVTAANWLVLALALVEQPGPVAIGLRLLVTVACYPLVVAVTRFALGLRRGVPGEIEAAAGPRP